MPAAIGAALQIGSSPSGEAETLARILASEDKILSSGASVVVMPEALLGGYPKGEIFGTQLGYRLPEGRDAFASYFENAIDVPGPETQALAALSTRTDASLVVRVIERDGNTLYCTALFFDPAAGLAAKHRELMPTGTERLIWGQGHGSTLPVLQTSAGRVGAAICQVQASPRQLGIDIPHWEADRPLIRGGSVVIGPMGDIIAGPLLNAQGLVAAEIDTGELVRARYDFDVVGHYSRPDVFSMTVDERPKTSVNFQA